MLQLSSCDGISMVDVVLGSYYFFLCLDFNLRLAYLDDNGRCRRILGFCPKIKIPAFSLLCFSAPAFVLLVRARAGVPMSMLYDQSHQ